MFDEDGSRFTKCEFCFIILAAWGERSLYVLLLMYVCNVYRKGGFFFVFIYIVG